MTKEDLCALTTSTVAKTCPLSFFLYPEWHFLWKVLFVLLQSEKNALGGELDMDSFFSERIKARVLTIAAVSAQNSTWSPRCLECLKLRLLLWTQQLLILRGHLGSQELLKSSLQKTGQALLRWNRDPLPEIRLYPIENGYFIIKYDKMEHGLGMLKCFTSVSCDLTEAQSKPHWWCYTCKIQLIWLVYF